MNSGDVIDICQSALLVVLGVTAYRQHSQLKDADRRLDELIARFESR